MRVTRDEAREIADAYFRSGMSLAGMKKILGSNFSVNMLKSPVVKHTIAKLGAKMRQKYTLEEHLEMLEQIRDRGLGESLKIALSAEIALAKAAGLYEKQVEETTLEGNPVTLTSAEIRARLAGLSDDEKLRLMQPTAAPNNDKPMKVVRQVDRDFDEDESIF